MKGKNFDLDRWRTKMRAPFESVFSQQTKRTRYRGVAKNQFSAFMEAICFNLKKLLVTDDAYLGDVYLKSGFCPEKPHNLLKK